jgi:hypothetical protein
MQERSLKIGGRFNNRSDKYLRNRLRRQTMKLDEKSKSNYFICGKDKKY